MLIPKVNRAAVAEIAISAPGERNCPGLQDRTPFPEWDCYGTTRSSRSIFGWSVLGYQPLCHPHQEGYHHAQGHPVGEVYLGPFQDHQILPKVNIYKS